MNDELTPDERSRAVDRWPARLAFAAGALALAGAIATDFASVVGRHLGHPFTGAIEIVQACIVVIVSSALIGATLAGAHAVVRVLTERMPVHVRTALARVANLLGAAFFIALSIGGGWLLSDTWATDERTDLLGLPIAPLRVIWVVATAFVAIVFAIQTVRPPKPSDEPL